MNLRIIETDCENGDFLELTKLLDLELDDRYGELQKSYEEHNKLGEIKDVIIIYEGENPVSCGAYKELEDNGVEFKRIYVIGDYRKKGFGRLMVNVLEEYARNNGYEYALLETGVKQHEAVNLYKSIGFSVIENYGPYSGNENSICMKKLL